MVFSKCPIIDVAIGPKYASEITTNIESRCSNINAFNTTDVLRCRN